jgi:hypothetical protein
MIQKMLPESLLHFWEQQEDMVMMLASTQDGYKDHKQSIKEGCTKRHQNQIHFNVLFK